MDFVSLRFNPDNPYIPDYATAAETGKHIYGAARFGIPVTAGAAFARGTIDAIVAASGAELYKIGDTVINNIGTSKCSIGKNGRFRVLRFTSKLGQSISIPIANKADLLTSAASIKTALSAAEFDVICIELMGERWIVNDVFGVDSDDTEKASPEPTTTGAGSYYSGRIVYESDNGTTAIEPVKIRTDVEDSPPTALTASWQACVGNLLDTNSCRSPGRREHRRYIVDFQTTIGEAKREIPVRKRATADISACGAAIVTDLEGSILCLKYHGETYNLFGRVVV